MVANTVAARVPVNRSATAARLMTTPAAPAAPCSNRNTTNTDIEVVIAQAAEVTTNSARPANSGSRRPSRSDSGPTISWPPPNPTMAADSDSWAPDAVLCNEFASSGNAGRYMSRHSGPNAESAPSSTTNPRRAARTGDGAVEPSAPTPIRWCRAVCW